MQLQAYDILLFKGEFIISKIIEWFTDSKYSHAGLYLGNWTIAEALPDGIIIDFLKDRPMGYDVFRYKYPLTNMQKDRLNEFVYLKIATKYNYKELFACLLKEKLGIDFPFVDDKLICSQFVDLSYRYAGINLVDLEKGKIVTPKNLSESKLLVRVDLFEDQDG